VRPHLSGLLSAGRSLASQRDQSVQHNGPEWRARDSTCGRHSSDGLWPIRSASEAAKLSANFNQFEWKLGPVAVARCSFQLPVAASSNKATGRLCVEKMAASQAPSGPLLGATFPSGRVSCSKRGAGNPLPFWLCFSSFRTVFRQPKMHRNQVESSRPLGVEELAYQLLAIGPLLSHWARLAQSGRAS